MTDLRAAVERMREAAIGAVLDQSSMELPTGFYIDREDTLDELRTVLDPLVEAIPEDGVWVTEEWLADALTWDHVQAAGWCTETHLPQAAAILRHLRETP